jgi:hypothetical protein
MIISQQELVAKLAAAHPGYDELPSKPPFGRKPPRRDCPICEGTGWAYSRWNTWLSCKCTNNDDAPEAHMDYTDR